jgi:acetoin utilization protein AcuB
MFVNQSMTEKVITVKPEDEVLLAQKLIVENKIRHLPVVDGDNTLVGIITDRDIRSALPDTVLKLLDCTPGDIDRIRSLKVKDVMHPDPITLSPADSIEDALLIIQQEKIGALPVVDPDHHLKGILSTRDLLRSFINVLGINEPGTLLGILAENKQGQMKRIVDIITEEKISMGSILVARHWDENKRAVFPYLLAQNLLGVKDKLVKAGFELIDPLDWHLDELSRGGSKSG